MPSGPAFPRRSTTSTQRPWPTSTPFTATLWLHQGEAAWHFVTLPEDVADEIDDLTAGERRGFGSVRVEATIGATTWRTSIFPDTTTKSFVLPVKKAVRSSEDLAEGADVAITLTVPPTFAPSIARTVDLKNRAAVTPSTSPTEAIRSPHATRAIAPQQLVRP